MAELRLTTELCQEDRARLDAILEALQASRPDCGKCTAAIADAMTHCCQVMDRNPKALELSLTTATEPPADVLPPATADDVQPITIEPPAAEPAPEPAPAPKTYSKDDVRRAVMTVARKGAAYKAKAKEALNRYAESVDSLKPEDYPAFMTELGGLQNG